MAGLIYHRPATVPDAVRLLEHGKVLAGGTAISGQRRELEQVVDLQRLDLKDMRQEEGWLVLGSGLTLQDIVQAGAPVPEALAEACRREAGWNLRNAATLGGTVYAGDGRSPVLTVLSALPCELEFEGETGRIGLAKALKRRRHEGNPGLLLRLRLKHADWLGYLQVARSPADRPLVCAALGKAAGESGYGLALGGCGDRPRLIGEPAAFKSSQTLRDAAARLYGDVEDAWASAEYRSHVAGVLAGRLMDKAVAR
jgi:CO/xanthine dehydrogenase FAD-binding subunit